MTLPSIKPEHSSAGRVWILSEEATELVRAASSPPGNCSVLNPGDSDAHFPSKTAVLRGRDGGGRLLVSALPTAAPFPASREEKGRMS